MSSINLQIIDPLLLHLPTSDLYISYDSTSISIHTLYVIITGEVRVLGDVWLRSCDRSVYTQTLSTFGVEDFREVDLQIETYFGLIPTHFSSLSKLRLCLKLYYATINDHNGIAETSG